MKIIRLSALLLLTVPASAAGVRVQAPVKVSVSPVVSGPSALALPAPAFHLSSPLDLTPKLAPTPEALAAPALTAQIQLSEAAQALTPQPGQAAPSAEAVSQTFFDGAETPKPSADAVMTPAPDSTSGGRTPLQKRAWETAELAVTSVPPHLFAAMASGLTHGTAGYPVVMAALWYGASEALAAHLGTLRQTVVGGWQASHDQKYRVGGDGQLRDVRGHKYGSDRYEEYAAGAVSVKERLTIAAAMTSMGLLWTQSSGLMTSLTFAGLMAAATAFALWRRARRPAPREALRTEEEKAHASRFK